MWPLTPDASGPDASRFAPERAFTIGAMRIVVLGGYGQFGGRISRSLARDDGVEILVAGRDPARAQAFIAASGNRARNMRALELDLTAEKFKERLQAVRPQLVIHAAGPFQHQDYAVAAAALACGAHYIDLADGRAFVSGIGALDALARWHECWAISGASSVPGLSAAVIAAYRPRFDTLDTIEIGISPGNRAPRGLATTTAILSYVGHPYRCLIDGAWRDVHGWQSLRRIAHPAIGARWLARCEVPDVGLLPHRYRQLTTCDFRAGLELHRMHFGLWLASWLVRARLLHSLVPWAKPLLSLSERWRGQGSDVGMMHVDLAGTGHDGQPLRLRWWLLARHGEGPQVPSTAAVVLARKLARGALPGCGAVPCLDLFSLGEFLDALEGDAIETSLETLTQ